MPHRSMSLRAPAILLASALLLGIAAPAATLAHDPPGIERFMKALARVESGGSYEAVNPTSGARGKYQIMPVNWPHWAKAYLGDAKAPWTRANQEAVARGKLHDLHGWLGSWAVTARWWLTGSGSHDRRTWSAFSTRYVAKVMALYGGSAVAATDDRAGIGDGSERIGYAGGWSKAGHDAYSGDSARYATKKGATATFWFRGRSIVWIGPKGPTRGSAKVWIDNAHVATVDLSAPRFTARRNLFETGWSNVGRHRIRIEVIGGGPVAIDEFRVGQ